jgi:hypothetical protein
MEHCFRLVVDAERPSYEQFGEFNSRITYLSFKEKPSSSKDFNYKMVTLLWLKLIFQYLTHALRWCDRLALWVTCLSSAQFMPPFFWPAFLSKHHSS